MSAADTGGPTFPQHVHTPMGGGASRLCVQGGMTLRDFFAGIALHTELMTCGVPGDAFDALRAVCEETGIDPVDHMAGNAYELADAMLRARQA